MEQQKNEIIEEKEIDNPLINKSLLDSHSNDSRIMSDLKNIDKNNDLSKSLSEINRKISVEDKKSISINSESNLIFNHPLSKKIIVQINQLSERVTKVENENEDNNRIMMKELRLKYFPNKRFKKNIDKNYSIFNENKVKYMPIKLPNNLTNCNTNSNNKIELNKRLVKQNLVLENTNEIKPNLNIIKNKNMNSESTNFNKEKFDKNNIFLNTLKEDVNYFDGINHIQKKELLKFSNDKDKIIFLLDKNREITDAFRNIFEKYKILKNEYIELYKNINNERPNFIEENDEYKKYLNNENKNMKIKLENYDKIFPPLINYVNDLNDELNLKKINFIDLKKSIVTYDSKINTDNKNNPINEFINLLNGNKNAINKRKKNEISNNKVMNKIRSNSNFNDFNKKFKDIFLTSKKDHKLKMRNFYGKL